MELILAFIAAHMIMKARGESATFAPDATPAGGITGWAQRTIRNRDQRPTAGNRASGTGTGGFADRWASWRDPSANVPSRASGTGTGGFADRWASWRDRRIHNAGQRADRQWRRIEHDQRHHRRLLGDEGDARSWWRRYRDQARTCPKCGHGGLVGHRGDCTCRSCRCHHQATPQWGPTRKPTPNPDDEQSPTPTGSDGPAASTDPTSPAPTDPAPAGTTSSTDERTKPVTAPTSPTTPVSPTSSRPVSPGASRPAAPAGSGGAASTSNLPPLDASDIRLQDARAHFTAYAANVTLISEGLRSREVDAQTTGKIADLAAQFRALVAGINRDYGAVEQAVNDSRHVAQRDAYRHR